MPHLSEKIVDVWLSRRRWRERHAVAVRSHSRLDILRGGSSIAELLGKSIDEDI